MARGIRADKPVVPGKRVGTKHRDMRWLAPDGTEWDSRFEYEVYLVHRNAGINIRKCRSPEDSAAYARSVRNGVCGECGSDQVSTSHSYTPDFSVVPEDPGQLSALAKDGGVFVIECKGYLRAERRSLLRALVKARPDLPLRILVQRDYKVTKSLTITEWVRKFLKRPVAIWRGSVPDWSVK